MPQQQSRFTRLAMRYRALWQVDPFAAMGIAFLLGLVPFLYAAFTPIGSVTFTRRFENGELFTQSVGYLWAINWWPALTVGFPLILFLALRSVQGTRAAAQAMVKARMFAAPDLSGSVDGVDAAIERLWRRAMVSGLIVFVIGAGVLMADWYCVVHIPLSLRTVVANVVDGASVQGCGSSIAHENDWSISSVFPSVAENAAAQLPSFATNYVFSLYVYLLLAVGAGITLAYFAFIASLSMTVFRIGEGRAGFVIVPNIKSPDPRNRCGFEVLDPVFRPCVYVTIVAFVIVLLTRVQNVFLRSDEATDIFNFLLEDFGNAISRVSIDITNFDAFLSALADGGRDLSNIFDTVSFSDPNSFLGLIAVLAVFVLIALSLSYILRSAANAAKNRVLQELSTAEGETRLEAYYGLSRAKIEKSTTAMESWPLGWPDLRQMLNLLIVGIVCFVFFKLIIIWAGFVVLRILRGQVRPSKQVTQ